MKIAAYVRVSTSNHSDSLDAQAEAISAWAAEQGDDVVGVFRDDGVSGTREGHEREGLVAALALIESGDAEALAVHRADRLARRLHVQEAILARIWQAGGRVFEAVSGEILRDDPSDPYRTFVRQVMGAAAELERSMIAARMQAGRRRKAASGGYHGGTRLHAKFGYRLVEGEYLPSEEQQETIRTIMALRAEGIAWRSIAATLNNLSIEPPSGETWHAMTVARIWQREHAAGS